ncbi:MAG: anhydro-N-acetylmuramic acid kinase [Puniceicoccaceae bacterium]|nr:MAG: anhydro-N-acetylmuramic acid kinase [Puniceicoccaceae bacterium]
MLWQSHPPASATGIGVMTGSSMDGIDLAFCRFTEAGAGGWDYRIEAAEVAPFPEGWRRRLERLPGGTARELAEAGAAFGRMLGAVVRAFAGRLGESPEFVASHGQTLFHEPGVGLTFQLGDGEWMVSELSCPLVDCFRGKDVALGGEGAPLVPLAERALFPGVDGFLNLGGIANISAGGRAWDVAPANTVLDRLFRIHDPDAGFDAGGRLAAAGRPLPRLLERLEEAEYFRRRPPKSLGGEWAERHVFPLLKAENARVEDLLHTYGLHLAQRVAADAAPLRGGRLMVTGGGAHNEFVVGCLRQALEPLAVTLVIPDREVVDFKEALCFAWLGLQVLCGRPTTDAAVTGARLPCVGGAIHLPPGWERQGLAPAAAGSAP